MDPESKRTCTGFATPNTNGVFLDSGLGFRVARSPSSHESSRLAFDIVCDASPVQSSRPIAIFRIDLKERAMIN